MPIKVYKDGILLGTYRGPEKAARALGISYKQLKYNVNTEYKVVEVYKTN